MSTIADGWSVGPALPPGTCPNCLNPESAFDHGVWEAVAMLLAQPLRDALDRHLNEHGCGTGDTTDPRYVGGFFHCPEAKRLWDLMPAGDRIVLA